MKALGIILSLWSLLTCTMWHSDTWGHVGLRANRRHHVFQSGSLIGLRSDGASRGMYVWGRLVVKSGSWVSRSWSERYDLLAIRLSVWIAGGYIYSWSVTKLEDLDANWDVNSCYNTNIIMLDNWLVWLSEDRRTQSQEPESEAGVRSPAILVNSELTIL